MMSAFFSYDFKFMDVYPRKTSEKMIFSGSVCHTEYKNLCIVSVCLHSTELFLPKQVLILKQIAVIVHRGFQNTFHCIFASADISPSAPPIQLPLTV